MRRYSRNSVRQLIRKVANTWKPGPKMTREEIAKLLQAPQGWIYFLRSGTLVKIGYTCDVNKRMATHLSSNPDAQLMAVIPGTRDDEKSYHARFKSLHYKLEWFRFAEELAEMLNDLMREPTHA